MVKSRKFLLWMEQVRSLGSVLENFLIIFLGKRRSFWWNNGGWVGYLLLESREWRAGVLLSGSGYSTKLFKPCSFKIFKILLQFLRKKKQKNWFKSFKFNKKFFQKYTNTIINFPKVNIKFIYNKIHLI